MRENLPIGPFPGKLETVGRYTVRWPGLRGPGLVVPNSTARTTGECRFVYQGGVGVTWQDGDHGRLPRYLHDHLRRMVIGRDR